MIIFPSVESGSGPSKLPSLGEASAPIFSTALPPRKLLSLSGSCVGADLAMDTDALSMGIVVVNSTVTKRLKLTNTGDVGCTYSLILEKFQKDLKFFPSTGFLAPGEAAALDVTFSPVTAGEFTAFMRCLMDGQPLAAQPLVISGFHLRVNLQLRLLFSTKINFFQPGVFRFFHL